MSKETIKDYQKSHGRFTPSWELNHPPITEHVEKSILRLLNCIELHCRCQHDCVQVASNLRDWYRWYHAQHKPANLRTHPYLIKKIDIEE